MGFRVKENDVEGVASLWCPCVDRPEKFKVVEVESKEDFNPNESGSGFSNPMLVLSQMQLVSRL